MSAPSRKRRSWRQRMGISAPALDDALAAARADPAYKLGKRAEHWSDGGIVKRQVHIGSRSEIIRTRRAKPGEPLYVAVQQTSHGETVVFSGGGGPLRTPTPQNGKELLRDAFERRRRTRS